MKRQAPKLQLRRETLHSLSSLSPSQLRPVAGGSPSIQSGETNCWCSETCDCCPTDVTVAAR
jgi:hypothetical protein